MEPRQQIKWAGNGDGNNVRLGVRWTRESLDYSKGVLSNLNYMEPHQQIKWAGNGDGRLGVRWTLTTPRECFQILIIIWSLINRSNGLGIIM